MRYTGYLTYFLFIIVFSTIAYSQDSLHVSLLSSIDTPADAQDLAVDGDYAYIADEVEGLIILNVSDRLNPVLVTTFTTVGAAMGIDIAGHLALIAAGEAGIQIIDVSNPDEPVAVSHLDLPGRATGITFDGQHVYVTANTAGLRIIDIQDPENPVEVGSCDTPGWAFDVVVEDRYAYVADEESGLRIIDVTDPANPSEIGSLDTDGWSYGVDYMSGLIYLADFHPGLAIIDVLNPEVPVEIGRLNTAGSAFDVSVDGNYALVADNSSGIRVINISDPVHPVEAGFYESPGQTLGIYSDQLYTYAAAGEYVHIFDCADVIPVYDPVEPTGVQYLVAVTEASVEEGDIVSGSRIGIYDGLLCVGSTRYIGEWPVQVICWGALPEEDLVGYIPGNTIDYRVWSRDHFAEFIAEPGYSIGNGEFGDGQLSQVALTALQGAVLDIQYAEYNFGWQALNNPDEWILLIRNTGQDELHITSVTSTDEHFQVDIQNLILAPQEEIDVTITFTPTQATEYSANIIIECDVPLHPEIFFPVTGIGYSLDDFEINEVQYDFGRIPVGNESLWEVQLTNNLPHEVELASITSTDQEFTVDQNQMLLAVGETATLTVTFTPELPIDYSGQILMQMVAPVELQYTLHVQGIGGTQILLPLRGNYFELVSSFLVPENPAVDRVFSMESLQIVYDHAGGFYVPDIINTIGDIQLHRGYQVFVSDASVWEVEGSLVNPEMEYIVSAGTWNWIGYPFPYEVPVTDALASISDIIVIVFTDDGRLWIPDLNINTIDLMIPGEGYMIITREDVTFRYSEPEVIFQTRTQEDIIANACGNVRGLVQPTGLPYAILVSVSEEVQRLHPALIEVYDGDELVGSAIFDENNAVTPVIAWQGSKEHNIPGFTTGNPICVKVLSAAGKVIVDYPNSSSFDDPNVNAGSTSIEANFGDDPYAQITVHGINRTSLIPLEFKVDAPFPNPFNSTTTIPISLPDQSVVEVRVFNLLGQLKLHKEQSLMAGQHTLILNFEETNESFGSGLYFICVTVQDKRFTQKILYLR